MSHTFTGLVSLGETHSCERWFPCSCDWISVERRKSVESFSEFEAFTLRFYITFKNRLTVTFLIVPLIQFFVPLHYSHIFDDVELLYINIVLDYIKCNVSTTCSCFKCYEMSELMNWVCVNNEPCVVIID